MRLSCCNFADLKKHSNRIVMFGAGAIGQIVAPEILKQYDLLRYVNCYLDNDEKKWGSRITVHAIDFLINPPQYLEVCSDETVIIINISRFSNVITQLESMPCTKNMRCYIMPMLLIHNFCTFRSQGMPRMADAPLIPKKLHYMWFGGKPIPSNLKRCMESWKKYCPDYEIIEWNETNYDVHKHLYMKQAYDSHAYGFIPDYARLDILYNEGGFYLDTDVEIKRSIDDLRFQYAFCGVEKWQIINFGGLSGAVKGHPMIKEFLDARSDIYFLDDNGNQNRNTCGFYDTQTVLRMGYKLTGETQSIHSMNIYAYDYFHPYDYMSGIAHETENTYSSHWFHGGWMDERMKRANTETRNRYIKLYHKAIANEV